MTPSPRRPSWRRHLDDERAAFLLWVKFQRAGNWQRARFWRDVKDEKLKDAKRAKGEGRW